MIKRARRGITIPTAILRFLALRVADSPSAEFVSTALVLLDAIVFDITVLVGPFDFTGADEIVSSTSKLCQKRERSGAKPQRQDTISYISLSNTAYFSLGGTETRIVCILLVDPTYLATIAEALLPPPLTLLGTE